MIVFRIWRIIFEKPTGDQSFHHYEIGRTAFVERNICAVSARDGEHDAYVHHCCLISQHLHDLRLQATRKDIIVSIGEGKKAKQ